MTRRLMTATAALVLTSALLVGCSDDDEPSACGALQDLADEVRDLRDTDLIQEGTDEARSEVAEIGETWDEATAEADDQFGDELDAVDGAVDDLASTIEDHQGETLDEIEDQVTTQVDAVDAAWDDLTASVRSELGECDLSADD
jgi:hypothetical protein